MRNKTVTIMAAAVLFLLAIAHSQSYAAQGTGMPPCVPGSAFVPPNPADTSVEAQAKRLFPMASQAEQRCNYILQHLTEQIPVNRPPVQHVQISPPSRYLSCENGHWIESVMDDGSLIKLEDGSLWEVDQTDTVDSAL